jgi:hypothetical protein
LITSYISLVISTIALSLGLYNWRQSLVRFRAAFTVEELPRGCWNVKCTITNDSSRSISVIKAYIVSNNDIMTILTPEKATRGSDYFYKLDGQVIANTPDPTAFPVLLTAYQATIINRVVTQKPSDSKSYLIIQTARKKHRIKITTS